MLKKAEQKTRISDKEFVQKEIEKFKYSRQRNDMITGEHYYKGKQDILHRERMLKSLQDGINTITSNFLNQLEEDTRNTILVLVNYEGENLGEFRRNLAAYGAVKVRGQLIFLRKTASPPPYSLAVRE